MSGILWAVLGAGIGLLAPVLFLLWRRGVAEAGHPPPAPRRAPPPAPSPVRPSGGVKRKLALKFHGVSLKPGPNACKAVQALAGQRFLPEEVPSMPLSACDQQKCQCAFSHHGDRRDPEDRRSGWGTFGGFAPTLAEGNRRKKKRERRSGA